MKRPQTNMEIQRAVFVESLYTSLKKQAEKAVEEHTKFVSVASNYLKDGLEETECIELLMIDGLPRETAESYTAMAMNNEEVVDQDLPEYSFKFEDVLGKVYTSYDISKTVRASSDDEAWEKAEEIIDIESNISNIEPEKVISVNRIS